MGRKSTYTHEIAEAILERLSKGEPLAQICRDEGMPAARTVQDWCDVNPEFAAGYARARADGYDVIAADCLKIADDKSGDEIDTEQGVKFNSEFAARSKIRIETRLRLLKCWDPSRYGDRVQVEDKTPQKQLTREDARTILATSGLSIADIFGVLTKPAEPIALEIEETAQDPDCEDITNLAP
jgi:hypothetical protein